MSTLVHAGMPRLTVSVIADIAELERLRGPWERLLERSGGHHPSLTPTWLLTWCGVFGARGGRRLRTLVVREGRELVGLFPLLERRHWYHQMVPMKRVELIASGEDTADEILSEYLGPVVASGREAEVVDALAAHLAQRSATWQEMVFSQLDGESPAVRQLLPAFLARGFACDSRVVGHCPFIALPSTWGGYLAALSSADRYLVTRSLRDFERWAGPSSQVVVARTHEELRAGKHILHALHEHRWQARGQAGVFASPSFRRFHDLVLPALLDQGQLDLRWLVANGEPVAVSYGVVNDNRVYFYQGGRATAVPKGVRPGIVLHLHAIRAAIVAGRREYDFLGGDARYKLQLATATRPLVELRIARRSLPEMVRTAVGAGRSLAVEARNRARAEWARSRPPGAVVTRPSSPASVEGRA